jgi:hypothetical protein
MASPTRTSNQRRPKRPPNSWIIYRSDKVHELLPNGEGSSRLQADVSKMISTMWKQESAEVRAEYERRADAKKAEHHALYPDYRFQPMKKEEKERLREEKRLERERQRAHKKGRTRAPPSLEPAYVPAQLPYPIYYTPNISHGPTGPSPPISAASSPQEAVFPTDFQRNDIPRPTLLHDASEEILRCPPTPMHSVSPPSSSTVSSSVPGEALGRSDELEIVSPRPVGSRVSIPDSTLWPQQSNQHESNASAPSWADYGNFLPLYNPEPVGAIYRVLSV